MAFCSANKLWVLLKESKQFLAASFPGNDGGDLVTSQQNNNQKVCLDGQHYVILHAALRKTILEWLIVIYVVEQHS